jgi:hypothetical protein
VFMDFGLVAALGPGMTRTLLAIRYSPLYIPLARPRPGFWR